MADLKIGKGHSQNFDTMCRAIEEKHAVLLVCMDKLTMREELVIAAVGTDGKEFSFSPFAVLTAVHENPYDRFLPPNPEGGYGE